MIALLLAALAAAPAPAAGCATMPVMPGFERWFDAPVSVPGIERRAVLRLLPARTVNYAPPLVRPALPGSYGAAVPLAVARSGTYRIALSAGAWIDVVRGGARLEALGHEHGAACSGIAKIVEFRLRPGEYVIQLSEANAPAIAMMIVPVN